MGVDVKKFNELVGNSFVYRICPECTFVKGRHGFNIVMTGNCVQFEQPCDGCDKQNNYGILCVEAGKYQTNIDYSNQKDSIGKQKIFIRALGNGDVLYVLTSKDYNGQIEGFTSSAEIKLKNEQKSMTTTTSVYNDPTEFYTAARDYGTKNIKPLVKKSPGANNNNNNENNSSYSTLSFEEKILMVKSLSGSAQLFKISMGQFIEKTVEEFEVDLVINPNSGWAVVFQQSTETKLNSNKKKGCGFAIATAVVKNSPSVYKCKKSHYIITKNTIHSCGVNKCGEPLTNTTLNDCIDLFVNIIGYDKIKNNYVGYSTLSNYECVFGLSIGHTAKIASICHKLPIYFLAHTNGNPMNSICFGNYSKPSDKKLRVIGGNAYALLSNYKLSGNKIYFTNLWNVLVSMYFSFCNNIESIKLDDELFVNLSQNTGKLMKKDASAKPISFSEVVLAHIKENKSLYFSYCEECQHYMIHMKNKQIMCHGEQKCFEIKNDNALNMKKMMIQGISHGLNFYSVYGADVLTCSYVYDRIHPSIGLNAKYRAFHTSKNGDGRTSINKILQYDDEVLNLLNKMSRYYMGALMPVNNVSFVDYGFVKKLKDNPENLGFKLYDKDEDVDISNAYTGAYKMDDMLTICCVDLKKKQ